MFKRSHKKDGVGHQIGLFLREVIFEYFLTKNDCAVLEYANDVHYLFRYRKALGK